MSNFFLADRIKENSRTQGTGSIALDGAANGFSSFADFYASGDTVFYAITDNVKYEVGSGVYEFDGSTRVITRSPFRSSQVNVGPWHVNATSNSGPTDGQNGYFYPLWLSRSAAASGVGFSDGPYTNIMEHTFDEIPGVTFYMPSEHQGHAIVASHPGVSGANYYDASNLSLSSGQPVDFQVGLKEVFVTYPGKSAVYNGFGLAEGAAEPKHSGVAFWSNEQIINYSPSLIWDDDNDLLGINQPAPQYPIDVGGLVADAIIRASGFIDGGSGVLFSGGQLTDTLLTASGGTQLEPFLRNRLGTASNGVIELSGIVDQIIDFADQPPATVFAGPASGWCGTPPCADDAPTFRQLVVSDLPPAEDFQSDWSFVTQANFGLDGVTENTTATPFTAGMVALYKTSGEVTYDSGIFFDAINNRLTIGGNAATDSQLYTLEVKDEGTLLANSGYFNHLIFTDDLVRIGSNSNNTDIGNEHDNDLIVSIGAGTSVDCSGIYHGVFLGKDAARSASIGSGVIAIGEGAMINASGFDHVVVLGDDTLFQSADLDKFTTIGYQAGWAASGAAITEAIGYLSASGSKNISNVFAGGEGSAAEMSQSDSVVAIGENAGRQASGVSNVVALGKDVIKGASGIVNTVSVGESAASGSFDFYRTVAVGELTAVESSGFSQATLIGLAAGRYAQSLNDVIGIGQFATQSGLELDRTIALGALSASNASGSFNTYIGQDAGIGVSGHNNIELVSSGTNVSFLTHEASNKLNIGSIIAGDQSTYRVTVGNPDDASPSGTLFVRPASSSESAFIIQHKDQGDENVPYVMLKSGDATTFFQITNSGDVITSGCVNPSGGLLLDSITPTDWMNSTANRLYNEGGTLKWNGTAVAVGGGFTSFDLRGQIDNTADSGVEITTGQTIVFSGIHVDTQIDSGNRQIIIDAANLSGVLQNQITASSYTFDVVNSGVEGANRNEPTTIEQADTVALSGVSGVSIDFSTLTAGGSTTGLFVIGYDANNTYTFDVTNGLVAADTILNSEQLTFTGVSGLQFNYDDASNTFEVGASGLSGVLYQTIQDSGEFYKSQILENTTSGTAISGIAAYASGQVESFTVLGGTSGVVSENNTYILDRYGSGNIAQLNFPYSTVILDAYDIDPENPASTRDSDSPGEPIQSVIIGSGAAGVNLDNGDTGIVAVGALALTNTAGVLADRDYMVAIGYNASVLNSAKAGDTTNSISIGRDAGLGAGAGQVNIGYRAGRPNATQGEANQVGTICIGNQAGYSSHNLASGICIGIDANYNVVGDNRDPISIGYQAAYEASGDWSVINIGYQAGYQSSGCRDNTHVGREAMLGAYRSVESVAIGTDAGRRSSQMFQSVMLGYQAGYEASGNYGGLMIPQELENSVMIGWQAGRQAFQTNHSVFIGPKAGYNCKGVGNSISISCRSDWSTNYSPSPKQRDFDWAGPDHDSLLDIGWGIQGHIPRGGSSIHIGRRLDTKGGAIDYDNITNAALSVTARDDTQYTQQFFLNRVETGTSSQPADYAVSPQANYVLATEWKADEATKNLTTSASDTRIEDTMNPIINQNGLLVIKNCNGITINGINTRLFEDASKTREIMPGPGVVAIIDKDTAGSPAAEGAIAFARESSGGSNVYIWSYVAGQSF